MSVQSDVPPELKALSHFHGHLGPYVVIGYRMGSLAKAELIGKTKAVVRSGLRPPLSCLADGVQFSSGCTLGKGNIEVLDEGLAQATFSAGDHVLIITLREEVRRDIDASMSKQNEVALAMSIYRAELDSLFEIKRSW
jgi:formylmethanofuran dehydrogenase subunit E